MQIKLYGTPENTNELNTKVLSVLEELGLSDFIKVETTQDEELKQELSITKEPALVIEEEAIEFKDTIFEGIIPENEELKSMFISIIGGGDSGSCGSKDEDGSCGSCSSC